MALDSASPLYGLRLQAPGNNTNTWGGLLNDEALRLLEQAGDGVAAISVSGSFALTAGNFVANQARRRVLVLQGAPAGAFTVTVPNREKLWFLRNQTGQPATLATDGGAGVTVPAGEAAVLYCDGSNVALADDVTRAWVRAEIATAALSAEIPAQAGNAGRVLTTDGSQVGWKDVALGGGGEALTLGADLSLSAASPRVLALTMTAPHLSVRLPDAAALAAGGPHHVLANRGVHPFHLRAFDGRFLARVAPGRTAAVHLADPAAGLWLIADAAPAAMTAAPVTLDSSSVAEWQMASLGDNRAVVLYGTGAGLGKAAVAEATDGAIVLGTPVSLTAAQVSFLTVAGLSSDRALAVYANATGARTGRARTLEISGRAVALGAKTSLAESLMAQDVVALSPSQALAGFIERQGNQTAVAAVIDISDSAVTVGTPALITEPVGVGSLRLQPIDGGPVLAVSGTNPYALQSLVVTGSTVAAGAAVSATGYAGAAHLVPAGPGRVVVLSNSHLGLTSRVVTVSGTAIALGSVSEDAGQFAGQSALVAGAVAIDDARALLLVKAEGRLRALLIDHDGSRAVVTGAAQVAPEDGSTRAVVAASLDDGRILIGHAADRSGSDRQPVLRLIERG